MLLSDSDSEVTLCLNSLLIKNAFSLYPRRCGLSVDTDMRQEAGNVTLKSLALMENENVTHPLRVQRTQQLIYAI